jgi:hypothetical protein
MNAVWRVLSHMSLIKPQLILGNTLNVVLDSEPGISGRDLVPPPNS